MLFLHDSLYEPPDFLEVSLSKILLKKLCDCFGFLPAEGMTLGFLVPQGMHIGPDIILASPENAGRIRNWEILLLRVFLTPFAKPFGPESQDILCQIIKGFIGRRRHSRTGGP